MVKSIGKNVLFGSVEGSTRPSRDLTLIGNQYFLGGFLRLSGLAQNQLVGERGVFGRLLYYREFTAFDLGSLTQRVYGGHLARRGERLQSRAIPMTWQSLRWSGSIYAGADTVVGPAYLGFGYAQGGRTSVYLIIGQTVLMCGFIGVIDAPGAVREIYDGLVAVQHRGQDAAGIITYDGSRFHLKKGEGLVRDIFSAANVARLKGDLGAGPRALPDRRLRGRGGRAAVHGQLPVRHRDGAQRQRRQLRRAQGGPRGHVAARPVLGLRRRGDPQRLRRRAGAAANGAFSLDAYHAAVREVYRTVRGAYSVVGFVAGHGLFAFRDPYGIKPIAFGRRKIDGGYAYAVASESVVLSTIDYEILPWGSPGEALFVDRRRPRDA